MGPRSYHDFAKNIAFLGAKKWGLTCDRDISNSAIYTTAIYREYTVSETTWWIYTIWSSMELSRPVVVQYHGHLTLTLDLRFQGQIFKILYLRNRRADWHGTKGMWVDRMLHPLYDFQQSPHPWPWPWIFKVKFWKSRNSGVGWPIDMEQKGCESIECWTHVVTFKVPLFHGLDLGFSMSNFFKKSYLRNGLADWHGTKGMWVDRMLDLHCDFKLDLTHDLDLGFSR